LGPRKIPPSCPKSARGTRFEECHAAQKPEEAIQGEQEDATNSRNFDCRDDNLRRRGEVLRCSAESARN